MSCDYVKWSISYSDMDIFETISYVQWMHSPKIPKSEFLFHKRNKTLYHQCLCKRILLGSAPQMLVSLVLAMIQMIDIFCYNLQIPQRLVPIFWQHLSNGFTGFTYSIGTLDKGVKNTSLPGSTAVVNSILGSTTILSTWSILQFEVAQRFFSIYTNI